MTEMTRRNFLKTSGASIAAAGLVMSGLDITYAAKPYGDLRMGMQSYTFRSFSFEDAMKKLHVVCVCVRVRTRFKVLLATVN